MGRDVLIEILRAYNTALRESGATRLFMYGSRAVGTPRPDSDVDLFIDYDPAVRIPSLFRLMEIEEDMAKALGVPVSITTRQALHPLMRINIERDAIRVA
jgi:predicted nucleotidyltransferase